MMSWQKASRERAVGEAHGAGGDAALCSARVGGRGASWTAGGDKEPCVTRRHLMRGSHSGSKDDIVTTAQRVVSRHLGSSVRAPRIAALAHDLSLVATGCRVGVLWDYSEVLLGSSTPDSGFTTAGTATRLEDIRGALDELGLENVGLLSIGPSLFVINVHMLTHRLQEQEAGGPLSSSTALVAVDASLGTPRSCTDAERAAISERLRVLAAPLHAALKACSVVGESDGRYRQRFVLELTCADALLVAVHGWLLEYPVIYCFVTAPPARASGEAEPVAHSSAQASCLTGQPLRVCRLTALPPPPPAKATAAKLQQPSPRRAAEMPHLISSFSWPEKVLRTTSARGHEDAEDSSTEDESQGDGAECGPIASWEAHMRERLVDAGWREIRLETAYVTHDSVTL